MYAWYGVRVEHVQFLLARPVMMAGAGAMVGALWFQLHASQERDISYPSHRGGVYAVRATRGCIPVCVYVHTYDTGVVASACSLLNLFERVVVIY